MNKGRRSFNRSGFNCLTLDRLLTMWAASTGYSDEARVEQREATADQNCWVVMVDDWAERDA